jgi:hypothetical protein
VLLGRLPIGVLLEILDFSQNFTIRCADEVQAAYWDVVSVTMHGIVTYYRCPKEGCDAVVKHDFIQLSNTKEHDHFIPRLAVQLVNNELKRMGVSVTKIVQFCDNCLAHYKSQRPFVEITRSALAIIRMFFGEHHGKSACDALFSNIKRSLERFIHKKNSKYNPNPFLIRNAEDMFQACKTHLEKPVTEDDHHGITFHYVTKKDIRRSRDPTAATVDTTKQFHSVANTGEALKLKSRKVGCVCLGCLEQEDCKNSQIVDDWAHHDLMPLKNKSQYAVQQM